MPLIEFGQGAGSLCSPARFFTFCLNQKNQKVVEFVGVYWDDCDETMQTKYAGRSSNCWGLGHPTSGAPTAHMCAIVLGFPMFDAILNQNVRR